MLEKQTAINNANFMPSYSKTKICFKKQVSTFFNKKK